MSEIKISEMLEAEEVNDEDLIMIVQNGVNKKVKAEKVGTGTGGGDSEEIGSVKMWFSNTIPANWLLLNGQAISRTEYSELFEILGTTYGAGDGSTTFNLPDMRGYVPVGLKSDDDIFNVLGKKVGEKKHTMTIQELIEHYHKDGVQTGRLFGEAGTGSNSCAVAIDKNQGQTASAGGSQPFNVIQPSFVCNFIIKAKKEKTVQKDLTLSEVLEEVIKKENEEATETNVYSSKAIDEMNVKNIAVAYDNGEGQQNLNAEYNKISLTNADVVGNKLKFENGKIVIGKGVKKVKISATAFLENMNFEKISYVWFQVLQNGIRRCGSISSGVPVWFQSIIISDYILDVKENDYLELELNNANYTTHTPTVRRKRENTRLYVEVIG